MKQDSSIAVIRGGKAVTGRVDISGSKHSALHILGAALLADGEVVIDYFPTIEDALNMLRIYQSMGVACKVEGQTAVLSVNPENIRFDESQLHLVPRLRSSILLLGSFLLRNRYLKMPIPGGDKIDPNGQRSIDELMVVLDMFGIRHELREDTLEAHLEGTLEGDRNIDLGNRELFWFPTGNSRTALAMILAAGNRGRTIIRSALRAAEIQQLGGFLQSLGYGVDGLWTDTLDIQGEGVGEASHARTVRVALVPDKCEIAFWIVAACLTRGDLVLRFPREFSGYSLDDFGPLYRFNEAIGSRMNLPIEKISDCEFRITGANTRFRGIDLILDNLETEFNGKVMDASPYFIPLMCVAEGDSRYLDGKFGNSRVAFSKELNKLGACIHVDVDGTARIQGGRRLQGKHVWCEAGEIRGAGALLLSLLAIEAENRLVGVDYLRRANDYIPKLAQLGCDLCYIASGNKDDLALGMESRVRKITLLSHGAIGVDYEERPPVVFNQVASFAEIVLAAFLHPDLQGARGLTSLITELSEMPLLSLEITPVSQRSVKVLLHLRSGTTIRRKLERDWENNRVYSGLQEYVGIHFGGRHYFAGRCLNPVRFEEWQTRIAEILSSPEKIWIPLIVTIGITDCCNYHCEFCFAKGKERRDSLPKATLLRLLDQLAEAGVVAVRFVGDGEATIHPDFIEALLLAKTLGLGTFLITNGSTLNLHPRIFAGCLDSIRVSINCAEAASYLRMHGVPESTFDSVLHGIERVKRPAAKADSGRRPLLGASYLITGANLDGMFSCAQALKSARADYLLFKKAHGVELGDPQRQLIEQNLRHAIDALEDGSFKIVPELFAYDVPELAADYYSGPAGCLLHQLRVVIQANGDVLTCNQKGTAFFARIGNIHRNSFLEIMNGVERKKALERRRQQGSVCPNCLFKDAHRLISEILKQSS